MDWVYDVDGSRTGSPFPVEKARALLSRYSRTTRLVPMLLAEEPYPVAMFCIHERRVGRFYRTKESSCDSYE